MNIATHQEQERGQYERISIFMRLYINEYGYEYQNENMNMDG